MAVARRGPPQAQSRPRRPRRQRHKAAGLSVRGALRLMLRAHALVNSAMMLMQAPPPKMRRRVLMARRPMQARAAMQGRQGKSACEGSVGGTRGRMMGSTSRGLRLQRFAGERGLRLPETAAPWALLQVGRAAWAACCPLDMHVPLGTSARNERPVLRRQWATTGQ